MAAIWALSWVISCMLCCAAAAERATHQQAWNQLLARVPAGGEIAVVMQAVGPAGDKPIVQHFPQRRQPIASVAKILVSIAALRQLGPDYHFVTRLVSTGPRNQQGAIPGLIVVGGGSPALDEHHSDGQPDRIFSRWAQQLIDAGITCIDGPVWVDHHLFTGPIRPTTYPQSRRNDQAWYTAPASALAWNNNCIEVRVVPGTIGGPGKVETRPVSGRIKVTNRSRTVAHVATPKLLVSRASSSNTISVSGNYHQTTSWFPLSIHQDPNLLAGDHFIHVARQSGLLVKAQRSELSQQPTTINDTQQILIEQRDSLMDALRIYNQRSHNFYGEQLIRVMAVHAGTTGSVIAGTETATAQLAALGLQEFTLLDGSGLSYGNEATAATIVEALRLAAEPRNANTLGHLAATLKPYTAKQTGIKVVLKTGSLNIARCLAGYISSGDQTYAFAILLHRDQASSIGWGSRLRYDILDWLVMLVP